MLGVCVENHKSSCALTACVATSVPPHTLHRRAATKEIAERATAMCGAAAPLLEGVSVDGDRVMFVETFAAAPAAASSSNRGEEVAEGVTVALALKLGAGSRTAQAASAGALRFTIALTWYCARMMGSTGRPSP